MIMKNIGLALVVGGVLSACANVVVTKVTSTTSSKGMIYALPKTVARVFIKLERTERQGAPYAAYAAIFAPDGDVICKDPDCTSELKVSYLLQEGATFTTYGEPDPDNVYLVEFSGGGTLDQTMSMTWNEAGLLSSAGASVTNRTTDVAMSGLKLLTGLGAKGLFGAGFVGAQKGPNGCPNNSTTNGNDGVVLGILKAHGGKATNALSERYCAIDLKERQSWIVDSQLLERATKAYVAEITPLDVTRSDVITGAVQSLAPAQLIEKIDAEISKKSAALYLGSKSSKSWDGTLDARGIVPAGPRSLEILRVNRALGFCVMGGAQIAPESKPVPKGFTTLVVGSTDCNNGDLVNLNWDYYPAQPDQLSTMITDDLEGDRSFRYRVPSQIRADLQDGNKVRTFGVGLMWVAQLGEVVSLPAKRRSKMLSYDLTFIESTGALKTFKLASTGAVEAGTIDSLAAAGGTYLDAANARDTKRKTAADAQKAAQDELTILTREASLLEMRDTICTLKKKYGQECDEAQE